VALEFEINFDDKRNTSLRLRFDPKRNIPRSWEVQDLFSAFPLLKTLVLVPHEKLKAQGIDNLRSEVTLVKPDLEMDVWKQRDTNLRRATRAYLGTGYKPNPGTGKRPKVVCRGLALY
jgi:hypothetical protein